MHRPILALAALLTIAVTAFLSITLFWPRSSTPSVEQRHDALMAEVLSRAAINRTVFLIQHRGDDDSWLRNLIASLHLHAENDQSQFLEHIVVWAYDEETYHRLAVETDWPTPVIYDHAAAHFSPFFDDKLTMMWDRPRFFTKILSMGYHLFFSDSDIYFFQSFEEVWRRVVDGGDDDDSADLAIQTDSRGWFSDTVAAGHDPYEGHSTVPPICAGFFWVRSCRLTVWMYELLGEMMNERGLNDQYALDFVLNEMDREFRVRLIELPEGLPPGRESNGSARDGELRIRLLDQAACMNGAVLTDSSPRTASYRERVLNNRTESLIMAHANFPGWFDKKEEMRKLGLWHVN